MESDSPLTITERCQTRRRWMPCTVWSPSSLWLKAQPLKSGSPRTITLSRILHWWEEESFEDVTCVCAGPSLLSYSQLYIIRICSYAMQTYSDRMYFLRYINITFWLCAEHTVLSRNVRTWKIYLFSSVKQGLNPNQSGIPADSKGAACWYFYTNWCWSFNTNSPIPRL